MEVRAISMMESVECFGCERGQALCENPCWGTPSDMRKLIDQGHGSNLMLNILLLQNFRLAQVLGPALQEYEGRYFFGQQSDFSAHGCSFQNSYSKLCKVHKSKPFEGKVACCKRFIGVQGEQETQQIRYSIAYHWVEGIGGKIVREWKRNYLKDFPLDDDQLRQIAAKRIAKKLAEITYENGEQK